jgi:hypothetical protein
VNTPASSLLTRPELAARTAPIAGEAEAAYPPLIAWLWATALSALAVVGFFHAAHHVGVPQSQAFLEFNRARVEDFAGTREEDELRVVMLGNSRLKYGTVDEAQLEELADRLGYGDMRFLRLVNNWATFADFAALADDLLAARPDVVVIQLELPAQERAERARALILREYVEWLLFGRDMWNPGNEDQRELQHGTPCASSENLEDRKRRVGRWLRLEPGGASAESARDFVAQAVALGAAVVVLPMPRTSTMERATEAATRELGAAASQLISRQPNVRLLVPPAVPDQLYCDLVHMNDLGRQRFSRWLIAALAGLAADRKPDRANR